MIEKYLIALEVNSVMHKSEVQSSQHKKVCNFPSALDCFYCFYCFYCVCLSERIVDSRQPFILGYRTSTDYNSGDL